jgi:electron transport complex protein RnfG
MFKRVFKTALVLIIICAVTTAALAFTQVITADKIKKRELEDMFLARSQVLPSALSFNEQTLLHEGENYTYFEAAGENGEAVGYVISGVSKGYGGDVEIMVGIDNGEIRGVEIVRSNETPGLGTKTQDKSYLGQYVGVLPQNGSFELGQGDGMVDAVSGATYSSSAVTDAVNKAIAVYKQVVGE